MLIIEEVARTAEVHELDVEPVVNENVLGFDVSVRYTGIMEMFDCEYKLSEYYACQFLTEHLRILDQTVELAVAGKPHDIVKDASSTAIGRTIDAPNLKIADLYDASVTGFCAHLDFIKKGFQEF